MFVDSDSVFRLLDGALQKQGSDVLQPNQRAIVIDAHAETYQTILSYLIGLGLTKAQADLWARGPEFERDITLWRSLSRLGLYKAVEAGQRNPLDRFDREDELATLFQQRDTITVADSAGNVLFGRNASSGFRSIDLDDANETAGIT